MCSLSIIENSNTSILYELPPGKPNPEEKCTTGEDTRDRVKQSACKGNTCWYYTFNFIRKRIGKNPSEELVQGREMEKLCSSFRKARTKHEDSLPDIADQLHTQKGLKEIEAIDSEKAELFQSLGYRSSLSPFIEEFLEDGSYKNMHEFLLNKKFGKRVEITTKFLNELELNPEKLFESEMSVENGYEKHDWKKLDVFTKSACLDVFARKALAEIYGLQKSSWTPSKGIDGLIKELKTNGPLFIQGTFGSFAYIDEYFKTAQQIAGRDIYGWRKGAKRHEVTFLGHTVLLVGAAKVKDKAYAFFIDAVDPSDPKDRSKQKIYKISFNNLTSSICDLHARPGMTKDSPVGYAYFGNSKA